MKASLVVLCWLTLLLGASNAENSSCIYSAKIDPFQVYYMHNLEYPAPYRGQGMCQWSLQNAYEIQIKCRLDTPWSPQCQEDRLVIHSKSYPSQRYCGGSRFSLVTKDPSVILRFRWPSRSTGGKYFCSVTALQYKPHNIYNCLETDTMLPYDSIETEVNEFPMMCALVDFQIKLPFCGCTIIHNKYVLTAAHCVFNRTLSNIGVLVGDHDYTTGSDTNASWIYGVEKGIFRPNYYLHGRLDDIAVIEVKGWIQFNDRVAPVYLPFQHSSDTFTGLSVTALGWGPTKFGGVMSETLQKLGMIVQTTVECRSTYPTVNGDNICTYRRNKNTCGMQSGGPILWKNQTSQNFVLVGVMIYGIHCARIDSVNARVGAYIDWITSVTPHAYYSSIE